MTCRFQRVVLEYRRVDLERGRRAITARHRGAALQSQLRPPDGRPPDSVCLSLRRLTLRARPPRIAPRFRTIQLGAHNEPRHCAWPTNHADYDDRIVMAFWAVLQ